MSATTPAMSKQLHRRNRKRGNDFSRYIYKVLVDTSRANNRETPQISGKAMMTMNDFVTHAYQLIVTEAAALARYNNRRTLTARDIQSAVRLVLPGELARHAVSEGSKALFKFNDSLNADPLTPGARKRQAVATE